MFFFLAHVLFVLRHLFCTLPLSLSAFFIFAHHFTVHFCFLALLLHKHCPDTFWQNILLKKKCFIKLKKGNDAMKFIPIQGNGKLVCHREQRNVTFGTIVLIVCFCSSKWVCVSRRVYSMSFMVWLVLSVVECKSVNWVKRLSFKWNSAPYIANGIYYSNVLNSCRHIKYGMV